MWGLLERGPASPAGKASSSSSPRFCSFPSGTEQKQRREMAKGPASSGDPRPGRGHQQDRRAVPDPFRGSASAGVEWRGGESAATEVDREAAVVMNSDDAGRFGER